jgi:2,3-dihydroxy-2,3-dihydro-p-cumate dehydrogenase
MTQKLAGKVTIVTGAGRGLGVALAAQFAKDGATLLLADMEPEGLPGVADNARQLGCADVDWIVQDLSTEEGALICIDRALGRWNRVDILVNNAGGGVIRPFLEHTPETLRDTINRNLWTNIWCTRAVLPHMVRQGGGRIVSIGADSVHTGIPAHAGYNAAKGGVHALATGLAAEFAHNNITVNVVSPGGISTPAVQVLMAQREDGPDLLRFNNAREVLGRIPIRRFVEMGEVAALTAFLTYEETRAITGQIYSINGGQWML